MFVPGILLFGGVLAVVVLSIYARGANKELQRARKQLAEQKETTTLQKRRLDELESQASLQTQVIGELDRLLREKSAAMPWIADAVADLYWAQDERVARHLQFKKHPARSSAEIVREHGREKRVLRREKRLAEYRTAFYEHLFPWLRDIGYSEAEALSEPRVREISDTEDPASAWLSKDEWSLLPRVERYQRALDRYKDRRKNDWEIGRDYERFVGYKWETQGYDVTYYGAIKGFEDFGRDLIVFDRSGTITIIQCKYWSKFKTIPEATIFQLLGSTVSYFIERNGQAPKDFSELMTFARPYLYTSTKLEPRIKEIALAMGIRILEEDKIIDWPMIKCNLGVSNERIYHLPMDQQYDRVKISKPGECYVGSVAEAEQKGFRRAKRWVAADTA